MTDQQGKDRAMDIQTLLASFRHVGMPLLKAMSETPVEGEQSGHGILNTETFSALADGTVALTQALAKALGNDEGSLDPAVKWALAGSASQVVAASYHAMGRLLTDEEIDRLASVAVSLQERFKAQMIGEPEIQTAGMFRSRLMEAMVPVIGAVAQYAFGRAEHNLLTEVADRLVKTADQMTRALAPAGASPEQWRLLCWSILRAGGQIYTECHYAEADRLLYMNPDERAAYFAEHGAQVPMTLVWQAFNQRMAMLATLATYLEVPETVGLDGQGW